MATTHDLVPYRDAEDPHKPRLGARCGLIAGSDPDRKVLRVLGYGHCRGEDVPPRRASGSISSQYRRERLALPFFVLEAGAETVWASECRWLEPGHYERYTDTLRLVGYEVQLISVEQLREDLGDASAWDDLPPPDA